jgi:transposase
MILIASSCGAHRIHSPSDRLCDLLNCGIGALRRRAEYTKRERTQVQAAFNPVAITPEPEAASAPAVAERAGVIEIEFATGGRMRITGTVDARTVTALMRALAKGKRRR